MRAEIAGGGRVRVLEFVRDFEATVVATYGAVLRHVRIESS
ncbi:hypothetical protein [Rhodococcus sp. NPDC055024]